MVLDKTSIKQPSQKWLIAFGNVLIASGIFHILVMLWLGGQWEGSISWRKPILFGISTGVTMLSLGWILTLLPTSKYDRWLTPAVSSALVIEVALITIQQWRGEASHFNESTQLNLLVERSMTYLVAFAAGYIFLITARCFGKISGNSDIKFAIRSGMVFLTVSCLIGFAILFYGHFQLSRHENPEIYGQAGVMKFPHGIAIHAIQFLPAICLLLRTLKVTVHRRRMSVMWTSASLAIFLLFSSVQTFGGRERFDMTFISGALMTVAVVLLLPVVREVFTAVGKICFTHK